MNVTLSLDDRVVAEACRIAAARETTLNQLISDHLNELTRVDDMESVVRELDAMWSERTYRSRGPWSREEAHRSCPLDA